MPVFQDPGVSSPMNHVIISGAGGSGRTTTLRTFMRAAAEMHGPQGARFFMLDNSGALVTDYQHYRKLGFLKPTSYIMSKEKMDAMVEILTKLAAKRAPDQDKLMENPEMIQDRSYFTGPEIYVFVDNAESFLTNGYAKGPLEKALEVLPNYDVGIHFIMVTQASNLPTTMSSNKGMLSLADNHNPLFLLHSGPASAGAIIMSTKTRFMDMPKGRVQMFNRQEFSGRDVPHVQIAYTPPAPREDAPAAQE